MSELGENRARLIESIYRIALEPQTYDQFMGEWDAHISDRLEELQSLQGENTGDGAPATDEDPEIARHFEIASQLLETMAQRPRPEGVGHNSGERALGPQMLIDPGGRIVWFNATAQRLFGLTKTSRIDALPLQAKHRKSLERMCQSIRPDTHAASLRPVVLRVDPQGETRPLFLQARALSDQHEGDLLVVQKITPDWPVGISRMLAEDFDMSPSECAICELVAEGHGIEQIANLRGSAVSTVRTQVKKILAKAGARSQVDLVRLLFSLMRMVERYPAVASAVTSDRSIQVRLGDGRTLAAEVHGDLGGRPVVFFHGMLDGIGITPRFAKLLSDAGLRLICPIRPYYGSSDPAPGPAATAPDRLAQDVAALLAELDAGPALVLGHMAGSLYAYALAQHHPELVEGILSVSGSVPLQSTHYFATMSTRQRLVAYTARFTPRLLPFVLRAGINQMMNGGQRRFIRSMYQETPDDLAAVSDPEIYERIAAGHRFSVRQGHQAFEIDSQHMVSDWSHRVDGTQVPVRVLHGSDDPAVKIEAVRDFYDRRANRANLRVLDGLGQLIVYRRPETVVEELVALRSQAEWAGQCRRTALS